MEPKGKYVLAAKVTEAKEDNLETPMEEDDPNEPGDKLNDSVNSVLATPLGRRFFLEEFHLQFLFFFRILIILSILEPDFEEELPNIKSVPSSQDDEISKGNTPNIHTIIFLICSYRFLHPHYLFKSAF